MLSLEEANEQLTGEGADFEIRTEVIRGIPTRVMKGVPETLRSLLIDSRRHGDSDFLVFGEERLTYEQHYRAAVSLAHALASDFGVVKGDRVAIAMRNYPEWPVAFFAAAALGAVVVPLNAWWQGEEMEYGLKDSGATVLIADHERYTRVAPHLSGLDLAGVLVTRWPAGGPPRPQHALSLSEKAAPHSDKVELPDAVVDTDDDATIFYTSGTTGFPKGALGTHRNICTNVRTLDFLRERGALRTGAVPPPGQPASLLSVPLFHVTGCHSTMVPALHIGAKLVMTYRFDPDETVRLIERERITSFGGVPTLVWKVLECASFGEHDLSSVVRVGYGGAPAAPELVKRLGEAFPTATPSNGYGLTETSAVTSSNAGDTYREKPESVGPAVPVCEIKVVSDAGEELPIGERGELWIKGPNVIKGYWNKPEATAEAFTDGWLHSGDVARLDEEGFIFIVDRAKDMVIRGGENVYCVEVEAALFEHEDIIDAAVFGVPDRVLGEEVGASVQLRAGSQAEPDEIAEYLRSRVAGFKVPRHWHLSHDHFPRNANGKTMKRTLRAEMLTRLGIED